MRIIIPVGLAFLAAGPACAHKTQQVDRERDAAEAERVAASLGREPDADLGALTYVRMTSGRSDGAAVGVSDMEDARRRNADLQKPPAEAFEEGPRTSLMVDQSEAWWLRAPQFEGPRILSAPDPTENGDIMVPASAVGRETIMRVNLDEDGAVSRIVVVQSVDRRLDDYCLGLAGRSRFSPARWKGVPMRFTFLLPCRFDARGAAIDGPR